MRNRRIATDSDDLASIPLRQLRERLRELIQLRSTNAKETSQAAGLNDTYVHDILSGKSKNPRMAALQAIAQALSCDLQYLLGQSDTITTEEGRRGIRPMPVLYIAEGGAYRPMLGTLKTSETKTIHADLNASYPHARHFAAEVRDDSMSAAGITGGMFALCVDFATARLTVESGKLYLIRRTADGGKTHEISIRKAMAYSDRIEYRAESSREMYATVSVPVGSQMDDQESQVEPIGLVYGVQRIFY